jgi:hypothetical protein
MSKRRTFAQWLAAFAVAPLPLLAQGVAPAERFTDGKAQPGAPELEYVWDGVKYRFASFRTP